MKLKKLLTAFICTLAALTAAFAIAACSKPADVKATLVASEEKLIVIRADQTAGTLRDALEQFKSGEKLTYVSESGQYGEYITVINGYTPDASKNEFCAVYTSLSEYGGVTYSTTEYGSYEYGGKTLGSASYGASGLPLVVGEIYVLTVSTY